MAVLTRLPNEAIISGFKGTIDYYVYHASANPEVGMKGIPCARRWPRSPGRRRAPAVEAQWADFAYIAKQWNLLSPEMQTAYRELSTGTGYTGRDLFERAYLSGLYRYEH